MAASPRRESTTGRRRRLRREWYGPRSRLRPIRLWRYSLSVAAKPKPKDEAKDKPKPGTRESFLDSLRKFIPKDEPKKP
jgi:hypothetical protein